MKITVTRKTEEIYIAKSDIGYWQNGDKLDERLALSTNESYPIFLNLYAQAVDRKNGNRYMLITRFGISKVSSPVAFASVQNLKVGESVTLEK